MSQRAGMAELRPDLGTVGGSGVDEPTEETIVGTGLEHEVPRFLRIAIVDLNLTNERQGCAARRPSPIEPDLLVGRTTGTVSEGIRHRSLHQPVLEHDSTRKFQGRRKDVGIGLGAALFDHHVKVRRLARSCSPQKVRVFACPDRARIAQVEIDRAQMKTSKARLRRAVAATSTSLTDIRGIGVVTAAMIIGHVGDIARFKSAGHFASYNGTAPIEASSGERRRHRLNPRGNRQLNCAIHVAVATLLRYPCEGREYYDRKRAEGKSSKEAIRALKRQISNVVYRALIADARRISK